MPSKVYLDLKRQNGDFRAMPAYIEDSGACGVKWVNVHPRNKRRGLPTVMAVIILNDAATGYPLAIMDGTLITNLRTGAAGAIAAKYLANSGSLKVAVVGCGMQARTQLLALNELFKITGVLVWGREKSGAADFIRKMSHLRIDMRRAADVESCVRGADIVVTTTPSREPLVRSGWIPDCRQAGARGVHINAIGADAKGKEELEPSILKRAKIVVDDRAQAVHSGEINVPISKGIIRESDIYATLGEVIIGKKRGRVSRSEITVFDSTGLAIQDMAVANYVYKKALRKGVGSLCRLTNMYA